MSHWVPVPTGTFHWVKGYLAGLATGDRERHPSAHELLEELGGAEETAAREPVLCLTGDMLETLLNLAYFAYCATERWVVVRTIPEFMESELREVMRVTGATWPDDPLIKETVLAWARKLEEEG